jgi:hypothetical protein
MEEQKLTKEQAIEILIQVCAQFRGTIAEHELIKKAIEKIKELN